MNLGVLLDVAIGTAFIYLLLSFIASSVQEILAGAFTWRGTYLSKGIDVILDNRDTAAFKFVDLGDWLKAHFTKHAGATIADVVKKQQDDKVAAGGTITQEEKTLKRVVDVQRHPLVRSTPTTLPSYVPSRNFALALLEVMRDGSGSPLFTQVEKTVSDLPAGDLKITLTAFLNDAGGDLDKFRAKIEQWFDDSMDRVSGAYKRYTHAVMIVIGLFIAIGLNVDSYHVVKTLWQTPTLREAVVADAMKTVQETPDATPADPATPAKPPTVDDAVAQIRAFEDKQFPVGWPTPWPEKFWPFVWNALPGWITTALAVSLGAPFWFDLLKSLVNVRNAGVKPKRADAAPET